MADQPDQKWYPPPGHNQDETNRIAFDNLYQLQESIQAGKADAKPAEGGLSGTAVFSLNANNNVVLTVGNKTFTKLIFKDGRLQGVA